MKKGFFCWLLTLTLMLFTACGDDEVYDNTQNQEDQGTTLTGKDIVVTVDEKGNIKGHRFIRIDDTHFYIDGVKYYRAEHRTLYVNGYDKSSFKGAANIIATLEYDNGQIFNVTEISPNAFENCKEMTSVSIPSTVTYIGSDAFMGCDALKNASFVSLKSLCSIFYGNENSNPLYLTHNLFIDGVEIKGELELPDSRENYVIGPYVFYGYRGLSSVKIPYNVTGIGAYAFYGCDDLTTITINSNAVASNEYSESNGFREMFGKQVLNYIFGDNVTSLGRNLCSNCTELTSVTIPISVKSIGKDAFVGCQKLSIVDFASFESFINMDFGLGWSNPLWFTHRLYIAGKEIKDLVIPKSVKNIENLRGFGVDFNSIVVEYENPQYDSRDGCNAIIESESNTLVSGCKNTIIPNSVIMIDNFAFRNCEGLSSITVPNSVTSIGYYSFAGCSSLTNVAIGKNVTEICGGAFSDCRNLKDFSCYAIIPPNVVNEEDNIDNTFFGTDILKVTLHVPVSSIDSYKVKEPWSQFGSIVAIE